MEEARKTLDELDAQIAELIYKRMAVVDRIARIKHDQEAPVYRPEREKQVTDRLLSLVGDKYEEELLALYAKVFEVSRNRQEKLIAQMKGKV